MRHVDAIWEIPADILTNIACVGGNAPAYSPHLSHPPADLSRITIDGGHSRVKVLLQGPVLHR
jgi:hypothetical protein